MSNRKKLDRTKLPITVAAVRAENARRAGLPKSDEDRIEVLPIDRRSRRAMRHRVSVINLFHTHGDKK